MTDISKFPKYPAVPEEEFFWGSKQVMDKVLDDVDPKNKAKNLLWTTDASKELPIILKKNGVGSIPPSTICQVFKEMATNHPEFKALSVKNSQKQWETWNFKQYYDECNQFGKALISYGITLHKAVNIIGFNHPCWSIAFLGSILAAYMPVGVYTTNGPEACQYVAEHSDAEVVVVENEQHLQKYIKVQDNLPQLKLAIIYGGPVPKGVQAKFKVVHWQDFLKTGDQFKPAKPEDELQYRMDLAKPGKVCTLVYTSGTTGNPKGVMLSHDNYVWTSINSMMANDMYPADGNQRSVSYLPLSHVVAQLLDIVGAMVGGMHVHFADPTALQGSLTQYLQEVRPTIFFSVPRVWEKIQEKMQSMAAQNSALKQKIGNWAKSIGPEGTTQELKGQNPGFKFNIAKKVIYDNIKKAIGLDQAKYILVGAAPLSPNIRQYFLSLNIFIINGYGMSETTGPQTLSKPESFDKFDEKFARSAGLTVQGTDIIIFNPDKTGEGEICFKGRNRFMGYYKNEEATMKTIDEYGYLHSGDLGRLDERGNLSITGRLKELLITAGGENVAPVLIENEIKEELKFISNAMVVGDNKKFLTVLLTLKHELNKEGQLIPNKILPEAMVHLKQIGSPATTVADALKCPVVKKAIDQGIERANKKAISRAQNVQKWSLLDSDFTVDGGHLTPTLKLKRSVVTKMYQPQIEAMYTIPAL